MFNQRTSCPLLPEQHSSSKAQRELQSWNSMLFSRNNTRTNSTFLVKELVLEKAQNHAQKIGFLQKDHGPHSGNY